MRQRVSGNLFTHKTSTAMFGFKIKKACYKTNKDELHIHPCCIKFAF